MADDARSKKGSGGDEGRTDPHVERLRPDPSQPPQPVVVLEGLLGDSDRKGFRRLYFTPSLNYYAEFRSEDVVFDEAIPPEQAPLPGLDSSRVAIREGAQVDYTRTSTAKAVDEFDLDVRIDGLGGAGVWPLLTIGCRTFDTCATRCADLTCDRCTLDTCLRTQCDQATCATCLTCATQCGQATCETCRTQCFGRTCVTCRWCEVATHADPCRLDPGNWRDLP